MRELLNYRYNFFLILRNIIPTFQHAEWATAYRKAGPFGIAWEGFRSLVGTNAWPFFIESKGDWGRTQIQQLLATHGVTMWGWGYSQGNFMFRVKKQQAYWAEYLMLKNGVPVTGRLLHSEFPQTRTLPVYPDEQHKPPTTRRTGPTQPDNRVRRTTPPRTFQDPLTRINNFIDRLSNISL